MSYTTDGRTEKNNKGIKKTLIVSVMLINTNLLLLLFFAMLHIVIVEIFQLVAIGIKLPALKFKYLFST